MRAFFLDLLNNLDKLTGLKQMERLTAMPDAKKEINDLLDVLCRVSALFPLIPEEDQKKIIHQAVISDLELTSLNARIVYKWLVTHKDKYFRESHHVPNEQDPESKPLEGEARQEQLKIWASKLNEFASNVTTKSHVQAFEESLPPKEKGTVYKSTKSISEARLHLQYIKENYDPISGKPLLTWKSESDWLTSRTV